MKKIVSSILILFLMFTLVACSKGTAGYTPGTYKATSDGNNGKVVVEVEFDENEIKNVTVIEHSETVGLTDVVIERMPKQIIKYQSLNLDVVSGATVTGNAIISAVADAVEQANGDSKSLMNKEVNKDTSDKIVDKQVDVVIIGGGATGMGAAVSSSQNGAESVIVLEKSSALGGNAIVSGGYFEYINAPDELRPENTDGYTQVIENILKVEATDEVHAQMLIDLQKEYDEYLKSGSTKTFDSKILTALDYFQLEPYSSAEEMYGFATLLDDTAKWLTDLGMEWKPLTGIVGYTWPRWSSPMKGYEGRGYFDLFNESIEKNNYPVEVLLETPGEELIVEDGKVVGVLAKNVDGTQYKIMADKGVVIATGGFSANHDMVIEHNTMWEGIEDVKIHTNVGTLTGDGILMSEKVNAAIELMDDIMLFPMADPVSGTTENIVGDDGDALFVNKEGHRFIDETLDRYELSGAILEQTDKMHYLISDSVNALITDGKTFNGFDVEEMIANGQLFRADSIEELAEMIDIDSEVLRQTVDKYNAAASSFNDTEFGRVSFSENSVIDDGPFYALPRVVGRHITGGGLVRDEKFRVLDEDYAVIEGLYAGGEVTAGMSGISSIGDGMYIGQSIFDK